MEVVADRDTAPKAHRIAALDGVRALAILFVIGFHAGVPGFANGGAGVIVFFVLSGFLITTLLFAVPLTRRRLLLFYVRRLLRLYPALVVIVLFCAAYALIALDGHPRAFLLNQSRDSVLYVQDFALSTRSQIHDYGYLAHTWSLAVEEQFYLLWPLVLIVLLSCKAGYRTMLVSVAGLTVLAVVWRGYLSAEELHNRVGLGLDGNAESLLVGCTLAIVLLPGRWPGVVGVRLLHVSAVMSTLLLVVICTGQLWLPLDFLRLATALATASLIASVVLLPTSTMARVLSWRPLAYIGLVSYGLYLWHPIVFRIFQDHVELTDLRAKALWAPVMLSTTAAATLGSYYLVEKPFNAMKDRLSPTREKASVPPHTLPTVVLPSRSSPPLNAGRSGDSAPS